LSVGKIYFSLVFHASKAHVGSIGKIFHNSLVYNDNQLKFKKAQL